MSNVGHIYGSYMYFRTPDGNEIQDYGKAKQAWADQGYSLDPNGGISQGGGFASGAGGSSGSNAMSLGSMIGAGSTFPTSVPGGVNGGNLQTAGNAAAETADPWASQRGQYQTSLANLMNNPGDAMANNPMLQWQQQQGEQAVNRSAAANHQLGSGNRMAALSDYAQKQSGNNFFQLADLYSLLGGAKNQNPAAAAQLSYQGAKDTANYGLDQQKLAMDNNNAQMDLSLKGRAIDQGMYQFKNSKDYVQYAANQGNNSGNNAAFGSVF